jgi:hypothetical protein
MNQYDSWEKKNGGMRWWNENLMITGAMVTTYNGIWL